MKKNWILAGCLLAALTFCSCGGSSADTADSSAMTAAADSTSATETDSAVTTAPENASEGGMTLANPISTGEGGQPKAYKTLGDVMDEPDEIKQAGISFDGQYFVYLFGEQAHPIRAIAEIDENIRTQIGELDFMDADYNKKQQEIVKDLPIVRLEDLAEGITPQEELDSYIGKTGQELFDAGYEATGWMGDGTTTEFMLDKGMYEYTAVFEEQADLESDMDTADIVKPLTLKSMTYSGLNYNCCSVD